MKEDFIVIGFYTNNSPYEEEIKGLVKSCRQQKLSFVVKGYKPRGSWHRNTCIKAQFILEMMDEYPNKNLVYIDADGIVQQYPTLFDNLDADLGVHYKDGKECLSGTIFIRNNDKMRLFIKCWIATMDNRPTLTDQKALDAAINKYASGQHVRVYDLPPTYTQIFDLMKGAGKPVIEHFQASRRFKRSMSTDTKIPKRVCGVRTRDAGDGSFWLPRVTKGMEEFLNQNFNKFPNELRWYPKSSGEKDLDDVAGYFEGKDCYMVGKGPSLDQLTKKDFKDPRLPVICINESIHKVESLDLPNKVFAIQQDSWLKDTCKPKYAGIFLTTSCRYWYPEIKEKYVFHYTQIDLKSNNLTAIYAIAIARKYQSTGFIFLCFDSCVNNDTGYGSCIGYNSDRGGSPQRFLTHKRSFIDHASPLKIDFISPGVLAGEVCDTPQQSLQCHSRHRGHGRSLHPVYSPRKKD